MTTLTCAAASARSDENGDLKAAYQKGVVAYNLQRFGEALEAFQHAYEIKPEPSILFNLGQCERQLGHYAKAQGYYRTYLRESPSLAPSDAEVVKRLTKEMGDALLTQQVAQAAPPQQVAPPSATPVTGAQTPRPAQVDPHAARIKRLTGIGLMGSGAGFLVLGGVFVGLVYNANNAATSGNAYHPNQVTNRNTFEVFDTVSFAVGGAALVTGVVLYVLGRTPQKYAVAPVVSTSYAGAAAAVRF